MKLYISALLVQFLLFSSLSFSQQQALYTWWNPASSGFPVIEGQAWPKEVKDAYDRFPARAEKTITDKVWHLSNNSAGLYIKFKTDAKKLSVRYVVKGKLAFPHMPATGVSGVDLYGIDRDGKWFWSPGNYSFGDTIQYTFSALLSRDDSSGRSFEYRLYLPLYNTVSWLEIGASEGKNFTPIPLRGEKPIVVYGTSIAQGGCASKPGLAWTAQLERNLDRPLINLGFSGEGHLDKEVMDLINEIDAKVYVLDCIPNLIEESEYTPAEVNRRILAAVKQIRGKRPATPILLVEHSAGGQGHGINFGKNNAYDNTNEVLRKAFNTMISSGEKNLYLLSNKDIGFDMYSTVDGEHPTDIGMQQYAAAYEKILRKILKEPTGSASTTIPVAQSRDDFYYWPSRHQEILAQTKAAPPKMAVIGNSITHMWGGTPVSSIVHGRDSWEETFEPLHAINMGFGWDRIENVLWRVYHDELDGFSARQILLTIGTNNLDINSNQEIIEGLKMLIPAILLRQPSAQLLLSGIYPRREKEKRITLLNQKIAQLAASFKVTYVDPGKTLLKADRTINESLFTDGLHPNAVGYKKLAVALKPYLKK